MLQLQQCCKSKYKNLANYKNYYAKFKIRELKIKNLLLVLIKNSVY